MKLVDNWKDWWKMWTIRINIILGILLTILEHLVKINLIYFTISKSLTNSHPQNSATLLSDSVQLPLLF